MLRTIAISVAVLLAAIPARANPSREHAHVRPVNADLAKIFDEGVARSVTLRTMIEKLQQTDVVVMMDFDAGLSPDLAGGLRFITRAGSLRLLRVSIRRTLSHQLVLATIGHELQHALEVAGAPQIVDETSLRAFYRRLDRDGEASERYDTLEAQRAGDSVGLDLRASQRVSGILRERPAATIAQRKTR